MSYQFCWHRRRQKTTKRMNKLPSYLPEIALTAVGVALGVMLANWLSAQIASFLSKKA